MWPYWFMFCLPAVFAFVDQQSTRKSSGAVWFFAFLLVSLFIGLRHEVGGDWFSYLGNLQSGYSLSFWEAMQRLSSDPGYALVSWVAIQLGMGIYGVNLFAALVFTYGLAQFSRRQPLPWVALLVAVPYMVVVFAMGYTRQSVAFGFELLALNTLVDRKVRQFICLIALGSLFHKSAVILMPLGALVTPNNRLWNLAWVGVISIVCAIFIIGERSEALWNSYVSGGAIQSSGGGVRVALSALPAALALCWRKRIFRGATESRLWIIFSLLALVCVIFVPFASTAVDRVALYLMPLQIAVFSRLHRVTTAPQSRALLIMGIGVFYGAVQFVWLNFANHADAWVPYRFAQFW